MLLMNGKLLVRAAVVVAIVAVCCRGVGTLQAQTEVTDATVPSITVSDQVKKLMAPIEPLVGKNTFAVAHADLTKLELDSIVANWKDTVTMLAGKIKKDPTISTMLAENHADLDIDQVVKEYFAMLDKETPQVKMMFDNIKKAGLKEVYVLSNAATMMINPVRIVLIVENGTADEVLEALQMTHDPMFHSSVAIEKSDTMVILSLATPNANLNLKDDADLQRFKRTLGQVKPLERAEILAGFEKMKNAPIKIVFAPDAVLRGMLPMGLMLVPPPHNEIDTKVINAGIRWIAIGVDPMRFIFAETIQSESPEAAQKFSDLIRNVYNKAIDVQLDNMPGDPAFVEAIKKFTRAVTVFFPKVKGDQLNLVINNKFLEEESDAIVAAGGLILPAVMAAREAARRMQCTNNLKQIVLAMHNYHDVRKGFPAVYTVDQDGKPLHSWRVALLPYMEEFELYNKIKLDEPWDSEYNKQFHDKVPRVYQCPSHPEPGMTNYSVVVGKKCFFNEPKVRSLAAIVDGTSNTIAVVERTTSVCWMDPTQEITFEEACKGINAIDAENGLGSKHTGGMNAAFFDGSVQFISETIDLDVLRAMLTHADGESTGAW